MIWKFLLGENNKLDKSDTLTVKGFAFLSLAIAISILLNTIIQMTIRPKTNISLQELQPIKYYVGMFLPTVIDLACNAWAGVLFWRSRQERISILNTIGLMMSVSSLVVNLAMLVQLYSTILISIDSFRHYKDTFRGINPN